ncbi:MAG: phenylalanine--tRNA ligase subunit alpha [DPANN group archaeon]|nr:phenylalanine--tRNA ligase subunit alpha [DPANN group archaeon]
MANLTKLADSLQDNEIHILKALKRHGQASNAELQADTKLDQSAVARSALWLENKGLVEIKETKINVAALTKLGKNYITENLPERKLVEALAAGVTADKLITKFMDAREFNAALGYWRQKSAIIISKGKTELNEAGLSYKDKKTIEEKFISKFNSAEDFVISELPPEDREAFERLRKRGLATSDVRTARIFTITDLGARVADAVRPGEKIGQITPAIIKSGEWASKQFRRFDVEARVPEIFIGKKQAYVRFLEEVKDELVALGFEEMTGPLVELSFFNNDALYMPQDHPARGIHDVYSVRDPKYGSLDAHKHFLKEVATAHENGGRTGSTGWQYQFNEKEAARLILRTQGTALSARTMMSKNLKVPGAYFAVARVFRPDVLDATHLVEFNQTEGIVLDENASLRKLLGLLAEFAKKITGSDKVRFRPHYFPYTEPSIEVDIWSPALNKWVEALGAGIFRPEVTLPLGVKVPVLAWGIGVDRLFMIRESIKDIRQLFSQDISWLRGAKV